MTEAASAARDRGQLRLAWRARLRRTGLARLAGAGLAALIAAAPAAARADDARPDTEHLVLAGAGMAIPTYFLGVALHEGSHAVAGKLMGRDVVALSLWPGRHPQNGRFYFGYTQISGRLPPGKLAVFLIAPKLTDAVFLGGYAALVGFDALPDDRYAQLLLVVLATGFWVDFAKDIPPAAEHHDMPRIYTLAGFRTEWSRLPLRVAHAALSAAAAYALYRGYQRVFADDPAGAPAAAPDIPWTLPLAAWSF